MAEGEFEFKTRRAGNVEAYIKHASHVPQRFMERSNVTRFYADWFNMFYYF